MTIPSDFDSLWKEMLELYFRELMQFFFPSRPQRYRQRRLQRALRRDILEILNVRFQETSTQLDESVERIDAVDRLRLLLRSAATVGSIQEFMALVKEEGE